MVDVALIVVSVIVPLILVFVNLVILAKYLDPSATSGHYLAKLMIVLGLLFAEATVLLLPLDVGNRAGIVGCGYWNDDCGGLDLVIVWQIAYCIIAALVVVIFPFFIFFYENDDEGMEAEEASEGSCFKKLCNFRNCKRSCGAAICYTLVTVAISLIAVLVCYFYLAQTYIPYRLTTSDISTSAWQPVDLPIAASGVTRCSGGTGTCHLVCGTGTCNFSSARLEMPVTFIIYLAALMSWVGWFIFSVYVGIGFVALPLDMINGFIHRPKLLGVSEARAQRKALMNRAQELLRVGDGFASGIIDYSDEMHSKKERRKRKKVDSQEMNKFRVLVDALEVDLEQFQLCDPQNYREHYNPFVPWFKLIIGIIFGIMSILWILQIFLSMLFTPSIHPFLNTYFTWFDGWFPFFGTLSIAVFGLYLLLAAAKGNFKFGTRFFLIKVHPMEPRKTLMNSFVFNVALILLCVLPATQFCSDAFNEYIRLTDADVIFGQQFKYMTFFVYFWRYNVFLFMILGFFFLSVIYFSIFPSDKAHLQKVMNEIKTKKKGELKAFEKDLTRKGGALSQVDNGGGGGKRKK